MKKLLAPAAGAIFLLFGTTACIDMEYGLALERDLSGTATLDLNIDLERMAYVSAKMQKMFSGAEGEPTEEEIEDARQRLLEEMEEEEDLTEEGLRDEIEGDLPEGVELLEVEADDEGLERRVLVRFAFDHVDRLQEMNVASDDEAGSEAEAGGQAGAEPFGDLEVVDEGETLLVTNAPLNPMAEAREQMQGGMPGMEEMIAEAFEGLRVAFSIQAPFEIVEHNATRVDGRTLWWEFDFASLAQEGGGVPDHIMVRYRK